MRVPTKNAGLRFWQDQSGATAAEYAVIAAGIGGMVIAVVFALGDTVREDYFEKIQTALTDAIGGDTTE